MFDQLQVAMNHVRNPKQTSLSFGPFVGGLVTSKPASMLKGHECTEYKNIVIDDNGRPRTRPGWTKVCSGMAGSVHHIGDARVSGTWYTFISTEETVEAVTTYRLYRRNGTGVTQIGTDATFLGPITFVGLQDYLVIFDGDYVKYWNGTTVLLLSDAGSGADAYLVNNYAGELSSSFSPIQIYAYSATQTAALKFTTPAWAEGSSMPPTSFRFRAAKYGNGAYSPYATDSYKPKMTIRNTDFSLVATKDLMSFTDLPTVALESPDMGAFKEYEYTFLAEEISEDLSPSTDYYLCFEHAYGNIDHHVKLYGTSNTVGIGFKDDTVPPNAWTDIGYTMAPCFSLSSELPFKLETGIVSSSRIFGIEGVDGDYPGRIHYCGAGNIFDWSSSNFGGYMATGLDIAGIAAFYDNVWVFGSSKAPSLSRISGATPAEYAMTQSIQAVSSHQRAIITTQDDIIFYHKFGVDSINTMQEFGDIRASNRSDNIRNIVVPEFDSLAFTGFEPIYGLCLIKLNDTYGQRLYAFHTRIVGQRTTYYPVSTWDLNLPTEGGAAQSITALGNCESGLHLGTSKGVLYKLDDTLLTDDGNQPTYSIKSNVRTTGFGELTAWQMLFDVASDNGGTYDLKIYVNQSTTALMSTTITLPTSLTATSPDSASAFLADFKRLEMNFNFRSIQIAYENIVPSGTNHMYFGGAEMIALRAGGL